MVDRGALAIRSSCFTVYLRRDVQCMVWRNRTGVGCECTVGSRVRLLFSASDLLVGCEPARVTASAFLELSALFAGSLSAAQRRTGESLSDARDNLHQTVQELERTNVAFQAENAERKEAEEALQKAQSALARISLTALGEMTTSIAHEINQPLAAIVNNASACLRWLAANNVEEARRSAELIGRTVNGSYDAQSRVNRNLVSE